MEGIIGTRWVELVHELAEKLEAVGNPARLPELSREIDGKARHDELVERVGLLLEPKEELVNRRFALLDLVARAATASMALALNSPSP